MMLSKITVSPRKIATLQRLAWLRARSGAARSSAPAASPAVAAVYSPPMFASSAPVPTVIPIRIAAPALRAESSPSRLPSRDFPALISTTTSAASAARSATSSMGSPASRAPRPGSISSVDESGVANQPRQMPTASTRRKATVVTTVTGNSTCRDTGRENRLTRPCTPIADSPMTAR